MMINISILQCFSCLNKLLGFLRGGLNSCFDFQDVNQEIGNNFQTVKEMGGVFFGFCFVLVFGEFLSPCTHTHTHRDVSLYNLFDCSS